MTVQIKMDIYLVRGVQTMFREGPKYQAGDAFLMKRTFGHIKRGSPVVILKNLGKNKDDRTLVEIKDDMGHIEKNVPTTYLGRRLK